MGRDWESIVRAACVVAFAAAACAACGRDESHAEIAVLRISPERSTIDTATRLPLRVVALTEDGEIVSARRAEWSTLTGELTADGDRAVYSQGGDTVVTATLGGLSAHASVRVIATGHATIHVRDAWTDLPAAAVVTNP